MPGHLDIIEHMLVDESESGDPALSSGDLAKFVDRLAAVDDTAADAELIVQITHLERMKSACAAAQAKLTVAFAAETAAQPAGQQRNTNVQRSIAGQIGLARRDSPARGGRHLGLANILLHGCSIYIDGTHCLWDLPHIPRRLSGEPILDGALLGHFLLLCLIVSELPSALAIAAMRLGDLLFA